MNNAYIEKYKNDEDVKNALEVLKDKEKEYAEKEREAKKQKQAEYKQWYKSLSDEEKFNEQIRLAKEELKTLNAQKREHDRKKAKVKSQKDNYEKEQRLKKTGSIVENVLGRPMEENDYLKFERFLTQNKDCFLDAMSDNLYSIGLSVRLVNLLAKKGVHTVSELEEQIEQIIEMKGIGCKTLTSIQKCMLKYNSNSKWKDYTFTKNK